MPMNRPLPLNAGPMIAGLMVAGLMVAGLMVIGLAGPARAQDARAHVWQCGEHRLSVVFSGEAAEMETGGRRIALRQTVTASGARYEAVDDPGTWIWNKGRDLTASLAGTELPPCTPEEEEAAGFTARGNEPGWRVDLSGEDARIRLQDGTDETLPLPEPEDLADGRRYLLEGGAVLTVTDGLCHDTMTGLPHPARASLTWEGREMQGCAGAPWDLLAGAEWQVEDIAGTGVIDNSHVTIAFEDARAAGSGGCNRWFAAVNLTGEGLSFGPAGSTMMACPEALMQQERRFFEALAGVSGFEIDETGALLLTSGGETVLRARR